MVLMTITAFAVKSFADKFIAAGAGDLVDALQHLKGETGIATQHLLWLYCGKAQTVTR